MNTYKQIFDFIVLPLSSKSVHEHAPFSKSLLIVGPRGSGKKMLVHAVCNELGANLFDLTAENIAGKYTDAEGQQMLMHLVMKVCTRSLGVGLVRVVKWIIDKETDK